MVTPKIDTNLINNPDEIIEILAANAKDRIRESRDNTEFDTTVSFFRSNEFQQIKRVGTVERFDVLLMDEAGGDPTDDYIPRKLPFNVVGLDREFDAAHYVKRSNLDPVTGEMLQEEETIYSPLRPK
jgi:hypothetical protein